jgi:hypothetical protein
MRLLDHFIAIIANHREITEFHERISFFFFLQVQLLTGITPSLQIIRIRVVLDESERRAIVPDQMTAHGSRHRLSMAGAFHYPRLFHSVVPFLPPVIV